LGFLVHGLTYSNLMLYIYIHTYIHTYSSLWWCCYVVLLSELLVKGYLCVYVYIYIYTHTHIYIHTVCDRVVCGAEVVLWAVVRRGKGGVIYICML
jgi:hypothetical protein